MTNSQELRYDGKVVVVTGAGGGLGRAYAHFFGSRGASVVVNDLGGSLKGETGKDTGTRPADVVVQDIIRGGGKAVADYNSVEFGDKIIETAVSNFGTVHILINNAGILRDVSFKHMKDQDWDLVNMVHLKGTYKTSYAAWPYFRKQKFGRIINTTSSSGLYGSFGQANYSAAKLAIVGLTETLAKEGDRYNITANAICPVAASRMTETVLPPDLLAHLSPEKIVPVVAYLAHEQTHDSGGIHETAACWISKTRWERSKGALFKADQTLTPSAVLNRWDEVGDFSQGAQYPNGPNNFLELLEEAQNHAPNKQGEEISFKDKVAIVTGGGGGLGRTYALLLAKLGAKVVVNDLGNAEAVVKEIKEAGGEAVVDKHSVEDGDAVVQTAIDSYGAVHILINNAGILRDRSFTKMTEDLWDSVYKVHLRGAYKMCRAVWPHFLKQKYGRIVNTASTSGIYGNFGQANYAAAKLGVVGLAKTLALEGKKYNILVNSIAPNAGTAMTRTILPAEIVEKLKPEYVAPFTVLLVSDKCPETGQIFEIGSGWIGQTRWQRTAGVGFPANKPLVVEQVASRWSDIISFDRGEPTNPSSGQEAFMAIMNNITASEEEEESSSDESNVIGAWSEPTEYDYTAKDLILYNLGLGAKAKELEYTYEGSTDFTVIPTFGVIPPFNIPLGYDEAVPNFNPQKLLHGEQYLEILKWPLPDEGKLSCQSRIKDVVDKGKAAIAVTESVCKDESGQDVFRGVAQIFIRGSGGFGGKTKLEDLGNVTAANKIPNRSPDYTAEAKTAENQAALYRLSGDYNPLHIDPAFAAMANFPRPILHGLCSFGISGKILFEKYGQFKNIKVRFAGHVFPGETLRVEAWKEGSKVIFQTKVVERGTTAISAAAIELISKSSKL